MAKAFEKGLPSARVIWLAHADHYVFRSNEADVLREMNAFIAGDIGDPSTAPGPITTTSCLTVGDRTTSASQNRI